MGGRLAAYQELGCVHGLLGVHCDVQLAAQDAKKLLARLHAGFSRVNQVQIWWATPTFELVLCPCALNSSIDRMFSIFQYKHIRY